MLNNGSDSNFWACMTMWYRWQGYLENQLAYLLEADMVNGEYHSILDKDSLYYKGLKWYHEVYKRGLIDPDSINNDRPTQKVKVDGGYAQVPSGYLPGWAPTYLEYHIPGVKSYYSANSTYGDPRYMIGISAKTKNLDACLAYLDVLADPEAFLILTQGPDGEYWASDDKGNAALTDRAKEWLNSGHTTLPALRCHRRNAGTVEHSLYRDERYPDPVWRWRGRLPLRFYAGLERCQ